MKEQNRSNMPIKPNRLQTILQTVTAAKSLVILVLVIILAGAAVYIGVTLRNGQNESASSESATVKLRFQDIGELATQSVFATEVNVTQASRDLFGIAIPFTQSKYIYSYNVEINAGYDFQEIEYEVDEAHKTIQVRLPPAQVLNSRIDPDSFQLYHEEESIFRPIRMEENNEALVTMEQRAVEDSISNGLLENARTNAETILTGFFGQAYDLTEYKLMYVDK